MPPDLPAAKPAFEEAGGVTEAEGSSGSGRPASLWRGPGAVLAVALVLSMVLNAFEIIGSATAMPACLADIGGLPFYGWALSAPLAGSIAAAPLGGRLADRFGLSRPLAAAFAMFALGLVLTAIAPTMVLVAAGRFVQGLGAGALTTFQLVVVARWVPPDLRPRMLAALATAFVVPGIVGPSLAAAIAEGVGWRWVYGGMLPLLAIAAALLLREVVRRERHDHGRAAATGVHAGGAADVPWWGPPALAFGLAAAVAGLTSDDLRWWIASIAALVLAVAGFRATVPAGTLSRRPPPVSAAVRSAILGALAYLTFEAFIPLVLTDVRGESLLRASFPLTVAAFCWAGGSMVQARLSVATRPRAASIGGLLEAVGIALAVPLLTDFGPFWLAYPATGLASFGMGLAFTIDQAVAVEWADPGREGEASGAIQLANLLGGAVGTGVTAILVAQLHERLALGLGLGFGVMIVAGLGCAASALGLPDRRPPGP